MAYSLVGSVADLLAHQLVHPFVGLVVVGAVVGQAGDDERHFAESGWKSIWLSGLKSD